MHDTDRMRAEYEGSYETQEGVGYELGEDEFGEGEFDEIADGETGFGANEAALTEQEEIELASELLEVSNDAELDQFLGKLIKRVSRGASKLVRGPLGRQLGGILKKVARKALPLAGSAIGNMFAPGIGGAIGGKLASAAGSMFGLELEGLSNEDREFEVARRFVRFAGAAANNTRRAPARMPSRSAARRAALVAARRYAPGLLQLIAGTTGAGTCTCGGHDADAGDGEDSEYSFETRPSANGAAYRASSVPDYGGTGSARSGRWFRRGRRIIIMGV